MAILAMDTSQGALALACGDMDGHLLASWTTNAQKMHATLLNPLIDEMLSACKLDVSDVKGIIVGDGPGSYTGVRMAVTAAKVLAFTLKVPVVSMSSLSAAAFRARSPQTIVACLWDARRNEAYVGGYHAGEGVWECVFSEQKMPYELAVKGLYEQAATLGSASLLLLGDGAVRAKEIGASFGFDIPSFIYDDTNTVYADALYWLGLASVKERLSAKGEGELEKDAHALVPRYLQLAEAEARWRIKEWGSLHDGP